MEIRQVIADDLEHLVRIENLGFSEEEAATREAFITRIQLIPDSFLVALIDGQVVGYVNGPVIQSLYITDDLFAHVKQNPPAGGVQTILGLAVDPAFRRQGIATTLLDALEGVAKQANRQALSLTCKEELIHFYVSCGYENHGVSDSNHGQVKWFNLIKDLDAKEFKV